MLKNICRKTMVLGIFLVSVFSIANTTVLQISKESSVSLEQAKKLIETYKFNEKELAYKQAFLSIDNSHFREILGRFYDPDSTGVLSSVETIKELVVDCNVISYQAFSQDFSAIVFDAVAKGDTYLEARQQFDKSLKDAAANSEEDSKKILSMIQGATNIVDVCTQNQGMKLIP